jgi:hypothetical protein
MSSFARLNSTAIAVFTAAALGCASAGAPQKEQTATTRGVPLTSMAGRAVLVLPVQHNLIFTDSGPLQTQEARASRFLAALDDSIASSLGQRGLSATWTFAPAIVASARRNAGLVPDPHALAAGGLKRLVTASDDPLSEPLASQIRLLVALREGRYALLPAAVRFEDRLGGARATMVVYLIDSRTARIGWSGEVTSDALPPFSGQMARSIAERLADLVVAR